LVSSRPKRRRKQLAQKIDWHVELGVSELETRQRNIDAMHMHNGRYPVQGLCRRTASHALPRHCFWQVRSGHVPATEATVPGSRQRDQPPPHLKIPSSRAVFSCRLLANGYLFSETSRLSFSCITTSTYFRPPQLPTFCPLGLEHVQMEATTIASGLARHMDSRASSWLPGPENRWHPVPPHLSTAYVPNREPLAYRAGGS
jgi:hypothetical protein